MPTKLFISYSHEDKPVAKQVAEALINRGYEVFWDAKIPTGMTFDTYIYQELQGSKAVIVLWSKESIHSDYVKEEAEYAKKNSVLVPLNIDGTDPPFGFARIHCTDIAGWHGSMQDSRWQSVVDSIEAILGGETSSPARESQSVPPPPEPLKAKGAQVNVAATLATVIVLIMLVGLILGLAVHLISGYLLTPNVAQPDSAWRSMDSRLDLSIQLSPITLASTTVMLSGPPLLFASSTSRFAAVCRSGCDCTMR